ncbi:hypothetical protein KR009_006601, partial [Drosophila setifemur]
QRKSNAIFESAQEYGLALDGEVLRSATEEELTLRLELLDKTQASFIQIHGSLEELDFNEIGSPLPNEFEELILSLNDGYVEYADFFSMYSTIIDKEPDLSPIEKLLHLRSCLKGSALDAFRSLDISDENYAVTLDLFSKRFNNKRLVFQAHISAILSL